MTTMANTSASSLLAPPRDGDQSLADPVQISIAMQSNAFIEHMTREDLLTLISLAHCRLPVNLRAEHLCHRSIGELQALAFLLRRMCQERIGVRRA